MDRKNLLTLLTEKLQYAKQEARLVEARSQGEYGFVICVENHPLLDEHYMNNEEYYLLVNLYLFIRENKNLSDEEIAKLITSRSLKFDFVKKVYNTVPLMVETLQIYGPIKVAELYIQAVKDKENLCN